MMRASTAIVVGLVTCLLAAGSAGAQPAAGKLDHLTCYKMKDDLKVNALVNLRAELQPEFNQANCRVVKPTKFCVPTTKIVLSTENPGPEIVGQPLRDDYICYLLKCEQGFFPPIPAKLVADQFGRHRQGKYQPVEVCVPARKAQVPCGQIGTGKQCGGACPNDATGQPTACRFDDASGGCACAPQDCGGRPDKNGQCGGACPPEQGTCLPGLDAAGKPSCLCQNPPPPLCGPNTAAGTCGGSCPNPAEQCVGITTPNGIDCKCQPPEPGCKRDEAGGQCGGLCPKGLACVLSPVITDCRCEPPPQACGQNPLTGQCGGSCPAGSECRFVNEPGAPGCGCVEYVK